VSKKFCLLPQGFSEACAADCERRHRHLSLREVKELEGSGDIELLDVHPIRKTARYVLRVHETQKVHIPASVIQAAAGAYKQHRGETKRARLKVAQYGRETREFSNLVSVVLPGLTWSDEGLIGFYKSDGGTPPEGDPVCVRFKPAVPEARSAAAAYWRILREQSENPFVRTDGSFRSMAKSELRSWRAALAKLDGLWSEIVAEFLAGPFSEALMMTPASELPGMVLTKTLREYLR
jgi:hypothetical protein